MNKRTIILLLAIGIAGKSYSQTGCSCTPKAAPVQTNIVSLTFDPLTQRIKEYPSLDGLKKNMNYIFRLTPINSTLYSTKASANNISRTASLPPVITTLIPSPYNTTAVLTQMVFKFNNVPAANLTGPSPYTPYFLQRYQFDYDVLQVLTSQSKELISGLSSDLVSTTAANQDACAKLNAIKTAVAGFVKKVNPSDPDEISDFAIVTGKNLCNQKEFKSFVAITLADYQSRVKMFNNSDRPVGGQLTDDQLTIMNRISDLVSKEVPFILQCPDIIFTVINSQPYIDSNPYQITGDYLQVNIAILKPKFGDKADTVSINKINFYRVGYWKWIDVSTGIFYDNLASKSYYFDSSVPKAEISSRADVSVGALVHSYYVFDSGFKLGPCLGVSVSLLDGKSKYLAGGSFIFGKNNEWAFSGGYALANLPLPSNVYKTGLVTTTSTTTTTGTNPSTATTTTISSVSTTGAVSTYNKYQGGFFAGISYSLLKL